MRRTWSQLLTQTTPSRKLYSPRSPRSREWREKLQLMLLTHVSAMSVPVLPVPRMRNGTKPAAVIISSGM